MKRPVFTFQEERLTDAPFGALCERLSALEDPGRLPSLAPFRPWEAQAGPEALRLTWRRRRLGVEETGSLLMTPEAPGARIRLEGRLRGWAAPLLAGWLRWRTDRLIDRFVEDL